VALAYSPRIARPLDPGCDPAVAGRGRPLDDAPHALEAAGQHASDRVGPAPFDSRPGQRRVELRPRRVRVQDPREITRGDAVAQEVGQRARLHPAEATAEARETLGPAVP